MIIAALAECVTAVLFGTLADRIGSRKIMLFGLAFQIVFAFPFFWLLETRTPGLVILGIAIGFAFANGVISSVQPDYFARFFGTNIRYSGISIRREGATIIGGGLAPVIATALVASAQASWPVALCMVVTSVIGFIVVLFARTFAGLPKPGGMGLTFRSLMLRQSRGNDVVDYTDRHSGSDPDRRVAHLAVQLPMGLRTRWNRRTRADLVPP